MFLELSLITDYLIIPFADRSQLKEYMKGKYMKINLFNGETLKFDATESCIKFPKTAITIRVQIEAINQPLSQLAQFITTNVKMKKRKATVFTGKEFYFMQSGEILYRLKPITISDEGRLMIAPNYCIVNSILEARALESVKLEMPIEDIIRQIGIKKLDIDEQLLSKHGQLSRNAREGYKYSLVESIFLSSVEYLTLWDVAEDISVIASDFANCLTKVGAVKTVPLPLPGIRLDAFKMFREYDIAKILCNLQDYILSSATPKKVYYHYVDLYDLLLIFSEDIGQNILTQGPALQSKGTAESKTK